MKKIIQIAVLLFATGNTLAQGQQRDEDSITLREVINRYASDSGESVLVDPRVKGKVALLGGSTKSLSYDNFTTILKVHNFASYRSGGYLIVIPLNVIKQQAIELLKPEQKYVANELVTDIINLKKTCPQDLVPILRPLVSPTSHFAVITSPRALLITDTYQNTQRLREIIARIEIGMKTKKNCMIHAAKSSDY